MPIYTVGAGKTYDSADGILSALNAVPNNFASEIEDHIIEVYPGYDYVHNMSTKKIITNTSENKKLIIRPAPGHEHGGDFSAGITILFQDSNIRFYLMGNYIEIWDFKFKCAGTGNIGGYVILFNGNSNYCRLQNLLFDFDGTNVTPIARDVYAVWTEAGSFDNCLVNNCIGWFTNNGAGVAWRNPCFITIASTSANNTKVNNCVSFGANWSYYSIGLPVEYNNCGAIDGTNQWNLASSGTGKCNYGTEATGVGTNYLNLTKSNFKFFNIDNKNFKLKIDSPLSGTGTEVSTNNPRSVDNQLWNANHRSPFNATVIYNIFAQPPEDIDYIHGNWFNGLIFNTLSPGRTPLIGKQDTAFGEGLGFSHAGFITDMNAEKYDYSLYKTDSFKKFTVSAIFKGPSGGVYTIFGNAINGLEVSSSTQLGFISGSFSAKITPENFIDKNDYYSLVLSVDLEQSSNTERVKFYLFQKGAMHQPTVTFSGSAPSSFSISAPYIRHQDFQGVTSVWDRSLSFEEIYNILWDPYTIYRDEKKLLLLTEVISGSSGLSLWFLRKFILGD